MAKSGNKTQATSVDPTVFIAAMEDERKRTDCETLMALFAEVTKQPPVMWGPAIIGYGRYHYHYASGREGEFMMTGFSPRKQNLVVYVMPGFDGQEALLEALGKHSTGSSCLYLKRLEQIHLPTLKKIVRAGWREMIKRYGKP